MILERNIKPFKFNPVWLSLGVLFLLILHVGFSTYYKDKVESKIELMEIKINEQDSLFKDLYYSIVDTFEKSSFLVTATTWNPTKAQTDNSPHLTACGFKIDTLNPSKQRIIGLSRDLLEHFYYGEKVILENAGKFNGVYTVVDCGSKRLIRTVDICISRNELGGRFENVVLKHYD